MLLKTDFWLRQEKTKVDNVSFSGVDNITAPTSLEKYNVHVENLHVIRGLPIIG